MCNATIFPSPSSGRKYSLQMWQPHCGQEVLLYAIFHSPYVAAPISDSLFGCLEEFLQFLLISLAALLAANLGDDWKHSPAGDGDILGIHFLHCKSPFARPCQLYTT